MSTSVPQDHFCTYCDRRGSDVAFVDIIDGGSGPGYAIYACADCRVRYRFGDAVDKPVDGAPSPSIGLCSECVDETSPVLPHNGGAICEMCADAERQKGRTTAWEAQTPAGIARSEQQQDAP